MSRLETRLERRALAYIHDLTAAVPSRHKLDIRDTWNSILKGGGGGKGKKSVFLLRSLRIGNRIPKELYSYFWEVSQAR